MNDLTLFDWPATPTVPSDTEILEILAFAKRVGYKIGKGYDRLRVDRNDPFIIRHGGSGSLPDDALAPAAWACINIALSRLQAVTA